MRKLLEAIAKAKDDGILFHPMRTEPVYFPMENSLRTIFHKMKSNKLQKSEKLAKAGAGQLKQQFPDVHPDATKWTGENIKTNQTQSWFLHNVRKNPESFNDDNKQKLAHFDAIHSMDMKDGGKNFGSIKLHRDLPLEEGFKQFEEAEGKWKSKTPTLTAPKGEKIADLGNGWAWHNLGVGYCEDEGRAMNHCGNVMGRRHADDRILSLRKEVKVGNKTYHQPALTFINHKGWLGEQKGIGNSRPSSKYHEAIAALLSHPDIKGSYGGGYAPLSNFEFSDLHPSLQQKVKEKNPSFRDMNTIQDRNEARRALLDMERDAPGRYPADKHRHKLRLLDELDSGAISPSRMHNKDILLSAGHPSVSREHFTSQVDKATRHSLALASFNSSPHSRDPEVLSHLLSVENYWTASNMNLPEKEIVRAIFRLKSPPQQEDEFYYDEDGRPFALYNNLSRRKNISPALLDELVSFRPDLSAEFLSNRLSPEHIDDVVQRHAPSAAEFLGDKLLPHQIDRVVENAPWLAEHVKDKLLPHHIDYIVENAPGSFYGDLKSRLLPHHIDHIVENSPLHAVDGLRDRLLPHHIDQLVEKQPFYAMGILSNRLLPHHIDQLVEKHPQSAIEDLRDRLLPHHIDQLVMRRPDIAMNHLMHMLEPYHEDYLRKNHPEIVLSHFRAGNFFTTRT